MIIIVAFLVLMIPYQKMKPFAKWSLILLPPFFLLPYALLPIRDPKSMMLWYVANLFFWVSTISIVIHFIIILSKPSDKLLRLKIIRPALTITIYIFICFLSNTIYNYSKKMAITYAINIGEKIQKESISTGNSPKSLGNWSVGQSITGNPDATSIDFYKLAIPYEITYRQSENRKEFTVTLHVEYKTEVLVEGGVENDLTAIYRDEYTEYDIPID